MAGQGADLGAGGLDAGQRLLLATWEVPYVLSRGHRRACEAPLGGAWLAIGPHLAPLPQHPHRQGQARTRPEISARAWGLARAPGQVVAQTLRAARVHGPYLSPHLPGSATTP
jgi:hypothetical protein